MTATCLSLICAFLFAQAAPPAAKKDEPKKEPPAPVAVAKAHVVFVHACAEAKPVAVFVNGKDAVKELAFGKPSPAAAFDAGPAKIELKEGDKVVATANAVLAGDKNYVVVAMDKAGKVEGQAFEVKATAGKAHYMVVNAAAEAADVKVAGKEAKKGVAQGTAFDAAVDAGKLEIEVGAAKKAIEAKADMTYVLVAAGKAPKVELVQVEFKAPAPVAAAAPAPAVKKEEPKKEEVKKEEPKKEEPKKEAPKKEEPKKEEPKKDK